MTDFECPAPERVVPPQPWGRVGLLALALVLVGLGLWEWNARRLGHYPSYADTPGLWAIERRRVAELEDPVVAVGASRTFFDLDLGVWQELTGRPLVQLAIVGTSPRKFLTDLAEDSTFRGLALVGVEPEIFVGAGGFRMQFLEQARRETPSEWLGQQLAMPLERRLAFMDKDELPLFALLRHRRLPNRTGVDDPYFEVWRLNDIFDRRQSYMWREIETNARLRQHATMTWADRMDERPVATDAQIDTMLTANKRDVSRIRARGGEVVYVHWPVRDRYLSLQRRIVPRERVYDRLIRETEALGVHFEDHPALQGYDIPEWSHLAARETPRFTRALVPIIRQGLCDRHSPWAYRLGAPAGSCDPTEKRPT
jgi:hypothetical protein